MVGDRLSILLLLGQQRRLMSSLKEKDLLPLGPPVPEKRRFKTILLALALALYTLKLLLSIAGISLLSIDSGGTTNYCPQSDVLVPEKNSGFWSDLTESVGSDAFKTKAIDWLAGAVKVPSVGTYHPKNYFALTCYVVSELNPLTNLAQ